MPIDASVVEQVQELYRSASGVRPAALGEPAARAYLGDYIGFVRAVAPPRGRVLDVGCGSGWSSRLLGEAGFDVCGLDLTADALEVAASERLRFVTGSATSLPFDPASFDAVCAYQTVEHIPDPERAFAEFHRVLRPGGTVCVVGPNLLSLVDGLRAMLVYVWRNRPLSTIVMRRSGMPRHPTGNTLPEIAASLAERSRLIVSKRASREASFSMRTPDATPPFNADNDACYLCNPIDLAKYFGARGYRVVHTSKPGRPAWTSVVASGTWFAAEKAA